MNLPVSAQVNPTEIGLNFWSANCYNGNNFQTYRGFYTTTEMDFDTRDTWNESLSPSTASNYQGQSVNNNHHSIRFTRNGFECGYYDLHIPAVRRMVKLYVNGELIFQAAGNGTSHSSVWSGFLNENSLIEFELRSMTGDSYASLEFEEIVPASTVWNGAIDNDWFNDDNWSIGAPDNFMDAVVTNQGFAPQISNVTAQVGNLTLQSGSSLSIPSGSTLLLTANLNNNGIVDASEGTIEFTDNCLSANQVLNTANDMFIGELIKSGSGSLEITNGEVFIANTLNIESGTINTGGLITLLSSENGTAQLAPVLSGAELIGEITVERYFQTNHHGWVQLASPVQDQTFENWNEFILTSGFPGSDYPNFNFNNIRMYDETLIGHMDTGLYHASNITEPIESLKGYQVYTSSGTYTLSLIGEPIIGEQNFEVTFTSSSAEYNESYSAEHDGWNLVANPYPSTIDWEAAEGWQKANLTNSIHVWDASIGQYNMYIDGVSINGGSRYIPSSQAFWIQTIANNPVLIIDELAKTNEQGAFKNEVIADVLYLTLTGSNSYDQVAIRLIESIEESQIVDIPKLYSPLAVPKLGIAGVNQSNWGLKNFPATTGGEILLNHAIPVEGEYTISLDIEAQNYISCIFLEDTETGTWIDLRNQEYTFQADQTELINRFVLHLGEPLSIETSPVTCAGLHNGEINWPENDNWTVTLINDPDSSESSAVNGVISELPAGVYPLEIISNGVCAYNEVLEVFIESPLPIEAEHQVHDVECADEESGAVALIVSGGTTPYEVEWNNGSDDWQIVDLPAGEYTYVITDANGCELSGHAEVIVLDHVEAGFVLAEEDLTPGQYFIPENTSTPADLFIWSKGDGSQDIVGIAPQLVYTNPGTYNLQLTAVKGFCINIFEQEVNVHEMVTNTEAQHSEQSINISFQNGNIVVETEVNFPADLQMEVYNIAGQVLVSAQFNPATSDRWTVPFSETGVIVVHIFSSDHSVYKVSSIFAD